MELTRAGVLTHLLNEIKAQLEAERDELKFFRNFKGLSKSTMLEKVADQEQLIARTEAILSKAEKLKGSSTRLDLVVYQYKMGGWPMPGDPKLLASPVKTWDGVKAVSHRPAFSKYEVGSRHSYYHSRAEQDECEIILAKF